MQKLLLVTLICSLFQIKIVAQSDQSATETNTNTDHSYFKAGLSYLSNNVYNGRKDSLVVPYLTPSIGYYNKSGFFAKASVSALVSNYAQRIDLIELEAGYRFQIQDQFSGSITASRPFYNTASTSVKSETLGELDADFSWNIASAVSLNAGAGYMATTANADKYINLGLSHEFIFGENEEWSMEPSVVFNFGTRNYYDQYTQNRHLKTGKIKKGAKDSTLTDGGNIKTVVNTTVTTVDANKLLMLDSELSLSMYYDAGKWSFFATPTYAIPVNPATYVTTITTDRTFANGSTTHNTRTSNSTETISNTFYMELGVSYKF